MHMFPYVLSTGSPRALISRLATQRSVAVGETWQNDSDTQNDKYLSYSYRVVCDANYYGDKCLDICKARDDNRGHYTCGEDGQKVCLSGWKGDWCEERMYLYALYVRNLPVHVYFYMYAMYLHALST